MNRALVLAAMLALLSPWPAAAAGPAGISDPKGIVDTITPEGIRALVTEMGGKDAQIRDGDSNKVVTFTDGSTPYAFGIASCDVKPGRCLTLVMLVFIDMGGSGITADMVNERNKESFFNTALRMDDKVIAFGRGVLVEGGITRSNLASNISVFAGQVSEGVKHFSSQVVASNAYPGLTRNLSWGNAPVRAVLPTPQQLNAALKAHDAQMKAALGTSSAF